MKTEKRYAKVGELILITEAVVSFGEYKNGDVRRVIQSEGRNESQQHDLRPGQVYVNDAEVFIGSAEYEVITEEA